MRFFLLIRKLVQDEGGFAVVLVAVFLPILLLFAGFSLDYGRAFMLRHDLQSAADAASLAGASMTTAVTVDGTTTLAIVETWAHPEAELTFWKNIQANRLQEKGVQVLSYRGELQGIDSDRYYFEVEADIQSFLVGPLTGGNDRIRVVERAVGRPKMP